MRRILGFPVLATGLALGVQIYCPWLLDRGSSTAGAPGPEGELDATLPDAHAEIGSRSEGRTFSPGRVLATVAAGMAPPPSSPRLFPARSLALPQKAPDPDLVTTVSIVQDGTKSPWRTAPAPARDIAALDWVKVTSVKPEGASARYDLVIQIQRELRLAGCYAGEIDGSWGAGSKRALAAFMDRANAALPASEPDYILLTLIVGHRGLTCGATCPKGQSLAADDRCMPDVIVAQASRKWQVTSDETLSSDAIRMTSEPRLAWEGQIAARPGAIAQPLLPGRMSVGGPRALTPIAGGTSPGSQPLALALAESGFTSATDGAIAVGTLEPALARAEPPISVVAPLASDRPQRVSIERTSRPRAQKQAQRARSSVSGTRSVQHIFTHPLGRM